MFILTYSDQNDNTKMYKARRYYLPKDVIKNYNVIIKGKNFYDQPIDSDIKRYEEIRKLTKLSGCLLGYEYVKNHYKLIKVNFSRQKELDPYPKTIQHS